jgi:hypothetical protein
VRWRTLSTRVLVNSDVVKVHRWRFYVRDRLLRRQNDARVSLLKNAPAILLHHVRQVACLVSRRQHAVKSLMPTRNENHDHAAAMRTAGQYGWSTKRFTSSLYSHLSVAREGTSHKIGNFKLYRPPPSIPPSFPPWQNGGHLARSGPASAEVAVDRPLQQRLVIRRVRQHLDI